MTYALAIAWVLFLAVITVLAALELPWIWAVVIPLAIVLVATIPIWVGNILADRIEDHDHRRR